MSADTREGNKVVEAMVDAYRDALVDYLASYKTAMRASLLALADTITDEMAERGGRKLFLRSDLSVYRGWAEAQPLVKDRFLADARAVFAEMCRAAAEPAPHPQGERL